MRRLVCTLPSGRRLTIVLDDDADITMMGLTADPPKSRTPGPDDIAYRQVAGHIEVMDRESNPRIEASDS